MNKIRKRLRRKRKIQRWITLCKRTLYAFVLLFVCVQLFAINNHEAKNRETKEYLLTYEEEFLFPTVGTITAIDKSGSHANNGAVDIANELDTPILAAMDGEVIFSGTKDGYGNCIILQHSHDYSTLYAHLSRSLVVKGQKIQRGEKIGRMGSTGNSTGSHLHFEVRCHEKRENILKYFPFLEKNLSIISQSNGTITGK